MSSRTPRGRQAVRAAARIHDHLTCLPPRPGWAELPEESWDEAIRVTSRLRYALARGWHTAARTLLVDLDYLARQMGRELAQFQSNLPQSILPEHVARSHEIAADLAALTDEFSEVAIDLAEKSISVVTEPVELEGHVLGSFRIVLYWPDIGRKQAYEVIAEEPCRAAENEEVTHPHVQGGRLCEGQGTVPIRSALTEGRILDFFLLVSRVLDTYNAGSAHVPLERWSGVPCRDCGRIMPSDDHGACEACEDPLCDDCSRNCQGCQSVCCSDCLCDCASCAEPYCGSCLTPSGDNRLLCESCHQQQGQQENSHDQLQTSPADPAHYGPGDESCSPTAPLAPDPVRLGQADFLP
jgi:hypothetical protein